jgi:hypothetical protein
LHLPALAHAPVDQEVGNVLGEPGKHPNTSTLPRSAAHTSRDERQNLLDALGAPDPHLKIARDTAVKKPTGWSCDCEYWQ